MVTRRHFLQSAAALGLGASLFGGLTRRALGADGTPCRFVFVVEGNCVEPAALLSQAARAAFDSSNVQPIGNQRWWYRDYQHTAPIVVPDSGLASARSLGPLAANGEESSLEDKSAVIYGLSNKIAGGGHYTFSGALACARASLHAPGGATIDAFLSSLPQVRQSTPFDAVRLGVEPTSANSRLNYVTCAYAAGRPAPLIVDPTTAYGNLFASVGTPEQVGAFQRRGDLIDFGLTRTQKKLSCFVGGDDQRAKLIGYQTALEELLERQATLTAMSDVLTTVKPDGPEAIALYQSTDPRDRLEAQFQMARAALIGGLTNVVVLGIGTGGPFDLEFPAYNGVLDGRRRHDLHHESSGNAAFIDTIHDISRDYIALTAGLARGLEAIPEAGGTMLDHTVIVYMGDNGEQHHSTASEWPMLVIGGSALGLQTNGQTIGYPGLTTGGSDHRQVSSFFTTLAHAASESIARFGNEGTSLIAQGPLAEILS